MVHKSTLRVCALLLCAFLAACGAGAKDSPTTVRSNDGSLHVTGITLPVGFQMSVYASGLSWPRFMTIGPGGVLLATEGSTGRVIAIPPGKNPATGGKPVVIAKDLYLPTSLAYDHGELYIGDGDGVLRMALTNDLRLGTPQKIISLPSGGQHITRTVIVGPDGHLFVSIGSDCNVCLESDPHRAAVWIYNNDGTNGRLYTKGLRNAVGMAVNPWTNAIWVDVNGRDNLGDNTPPETIYQLVDGGDAGWPRCHAGTIKDPTYGKSPTACVGVLQPLLDMQAHSAPLGMAFYPSNVPSVTAFPSADQNSLYIAFHGSWNRTVKTGYKVVRIPLKNGTIAGPPQDFITGWLAPDGTVSGRPVGITFAPDGSLFVSDDQDGLIYHVWYTGKNS